MSWAYSGDPSSSTRDKLRFLIQDTDSTDQQFSNEELDAVLLDNSNSPYVAAISMAQFLVAKYSRKVDKRVGDLSISYSQMAKNYKDLLPQLRAQAAIAGAMAPPYAGGISVSDKQSQESDTDRVAPAFKIGVHDHP